MDDHGNRGDLPATHGRKPLLGHYQQGAEDGDVLDFLDRHPDALHSVLRAAELLQAHFGHARLLRVTRGSNVDELFVRVLIAPDEMPFREWQRRAQRVAEAVALACPQSDAWTLHIGALCEGVPMVRLRRDVAEAGLRALEELHRRTTENPVLGEALAVGGEAVAAPDDLASLRSGLRSALRDAGG